MICRSDLWKYSGLGGILLVTSDTEFGGIELDWLQRAGIISVSSERSMTSLAVDRGVPACLFCFGYI
jgi:hypothetical protein